MGWVYDVFKGFVAIKKPQIYVCPTIVSRVMYITR